MYVCMYVCIYSPTTGIEYSAKELTVVTRLMQSSSNELSTPVSTCCKQMEKFNTYTLNSLAYIGSAVGCELTLSG